MGGGGGPDFQPVERGRDVRAENTLFGTAQRGADFLGQGVFDQFQEPLRQLAQALGGQIPASSLPIANVLREESLLNQSTALRDIDARLSTTGGNRAQTGGLSILGQTISDFARDRSQIPARVIQDVIRNFLPIAQQQSQQQAGINQAGLSASGQFNPVSQGRQSQAINRTIAGQPPEQKSGGGIGQLLGTGLGALVGGPAGAAIGGGLGGSFGGGSSGGGIQLAPRTGATGGFFS